MLTKNGCSSRRESIFNTNLLGGCAKFELMVIALTVDNIKKKQAQRNNIHHAHQKYPPRSTISEVYFFSKSCCRRRCFIEALVSVTRC